MACIDDVLAVAETHHGLPYSWIGRKGPNAYDCSGHVWRALNNGAGINFADVSWTQARACYDAGLGLSIDEAIRTRGALLFMGANQGKGFGPGGIGASLAAGHVAFSLGNGMTSEARGRQWGVGSWPTANRKWTGAALIPGVDYSPKQPAPSLTREDDDMIVFQPGRSQKQHPEQLGYAYLDKTNKRVVLFNGASLGNDQAANYFGFEYREYPLDGNHGRTGVVGDVMAMVEWREGRSSKGVIVSTWAGALYRLAWS